MSELPAPKPTDVDAKLQAEIEAALGEMSFDEMVNLPQQSSIGKASSSTTPSPPAPTSAGASSPPPRRQAAPARGGSRGSSRGSSRERKTGSVVNVHGSDVFIEFSPRVQGVCPLEQFPEMPKLGEQFEFILNRFDPDDELYILSREGTVQKADWENLEVGQTIEARCTGSNKGGLEMEIANHKAFMPAGQVDIRHIEQLDVFIGEKMPCEIIELDRNKGRIILSRRKFLQVEREELRVKLLATLDVGQTLPAVITTIKPYGAFADLGGLDGLIHISDITYDRIKDPSERLKEGQQVQVNILKIDTSENPPRIGLGMKQLQADPFELTLNTIQVGAEVTGKITKLMQFGAFVELAPGVEGLIHISELSHQRINRPSQVVKPDEIITVKVLTIDSDQKRISLSLRAMQGGAVNEDEATREYQQREGGDKGGSKGKGGKKGRKPDPEKFLRNEDPHLRKLKASLAEKFGDQLKGGLG
ncbi:MAG: S1 RNA-binding domain-containing protein [Planctomycetota bacterium]|nr:S1 RNA-binding domain-containing protein [Planctomycetota bacterium]